MTHGNPPFGDDRHGTIGLPYPGTEARVVDFETGKLDMPFDGEWTRPGEIIIRGPQVMKGYWQPAGGDGGAAPRRLAAHRRHRPDAPRRLLPRRRPPQGHDHPLRHEHLPGRGRGRAARAPQGARGAGDRHPRRRCAASWSRPSWCRATASSSSEEEILAFCRQNLAKYKVPSAVEIRAGLRHSAVGKPLRRALREELQPGDGVSRGGGRADRPGHRGLRPGVGGDRVSGRPPGGRPAASRATGCAPWPARPATAAPLAARGIEIVTGDLADEDSLRPGRRRTAAGLPHRRQGRRLGAGRGIPAGQRRRHGQRDRRLPERPGCAAWSTSAR